MDSSRFTDAARGLLLQAISDAGGREVLAIGRLDEDGLVSQITVAARGSSNTVPALFPYMQKGDVVVHNHPTGALNPSSADLQVAAGLGNQGIGFYIVDNNLQSTYVVAEAVRANRRVPIDAGAAAVHLLPGGSLSKTVDYYEPRDSQVGMLEAVVKAFNDDSIVVAEAGTGVGKSLAYLIPAFQWVEKNDERVVVSTATINLQQQLMESDIPLVRKLTGSEVKVHLAKGRGNYVCLRRLAEALEDDILFAEDDPQLRAVKAWAESTPTGGKEDLAFFPPESLWSRVCSEADTCLGLRCARRNDCFVLKARREAAASRILVVNHHLLFSDQAIRASGAGYDLAAVLPPFQKLIFDEAHNIEKSATSFFSQSLSRFAIHRALSSLHRVRRGRMAGLIYSLMGITGRNETLDLIPGLIEKARAEAENLDAVGRNPEGAMASRFSREKETPWHLAVVEGLIEMGNSLEPIVGGLRKIIEDYRDEDEPEVIIAAKAIVRRLEAFALFCRVFGEYDEHPDRVFWTERRKTGSGEVYTVFNNAPVEIAGIMRETVFSHYDTVVCTSATLSVKGDFSYWYHRIGLDKEADRPVESHCLPSPFPFSRNVLLAIPTDGPAPAEDGYNDFVASFVRDAVELSEGGALVLFTSYKMLTEIYESISGSLGKTGIRLLRQGDDDRLRLLKVFSQDESSVLLATDSFWEGVDAPGDTLRLLVICRLPFQVPSDPVIEARYERIMKRNGNPFIELSLPEAVTRLKQGFGRLMRRATDRGVVLILDSRILKKQYGQAFIDSLPETKRCFSTKEVVLQDMERMLYGR
ncbi:MAG: DEAD/DEAH box helicase [Spirochaetales bacterium]|nr:DEAD/DEAH box helicase [Spirochaetales bacterium]